MTGIIPVTNGARVVAVDVTEEVAPGVDSSQYRVVGIALGESLVGDWITFMVTRDPSVNETVFECYNAHHFPGRLAATMDYEGRATRMRRKSREAEYRAARSVSGS